MKTLFGLSMILLAVAGVHACPACNIHNYMASNVFSATAVHVGIITEVNKSGTAYSVLQTVSGIDQKGETRYTPYVLTKPGDTLIFLDSVKPGMLRQEIFDYKYLQEIKFLRSLCDTVSLEDPHPFIADKTVAKHCLLGTSHLAVRHGQKFFAHYYFQHQYFLYQIADELIERIRTNTDIETAEWSVGNVIKVIADNGSPEAELYLIELASKLVDVKVNSVYRLKNHYPKGLDYVLYALLSTTRNNKALSAKITAIFNPQLAHLDDHTLAAYSFAIHLANVELDFPLSKIVAVKRHNILASGMLKSARRNYFGGRLSASKRNAEKALSLATNRKLKKQIRCEITRAQNWLKN